MRPFGIVFGTVVIGLALLACKKPEKPKDWDEEPLEPGHFLARIDGTSDRDVWVLSNNSAYRYDGTRWYDHKLSVLELSAVTSDDVWFGGYMGSVIHHDGKKPETFVIDAARKAYKDVKSIQAWPGEVWVVAGDVGYWRKTGTQDWVHEDPVALRGWKVLNLWGKKKTDLWAGIFRDNRAKVAHFVNGTWTIIDRPPGLGFAGTATDDVWFMGADAMVHWNGTSFTEHPLPVKQVRLYGIAAASPTDALVVGDDGIVIRWDGTSWKERPRLGRQSVNRVFAPPNGRYRAIAGGSVWVSNTP